ncbi:aminoglycoside adenylyltransferase domain-containing protein [Paenibacillus sp. GYB003]|uniref:aminoglycoside adenylyltransferase domain-containing protein n=1 Tax=Paenibacillus sp. GYB003 TaxID=2994392 RepID=UPI002F961B5B
MVESKPQRWPDCDADLKRFVDHLVDRLAGELERRLTGVYLHGSLAMGSYYRPKSDIDLIVVVDGKLPSELAESVGISIANAAAGRPTLGGVELSAITADTAKRVPAPIPFEIHYSPSWHERILNREVDYSRERTDPDLFSNLTYVVQRGVCVYGEPIADVFGQVDWKHFMESVLDDFNWILEDEHLVETPFYGVLNVCRVLRLLAENDRSVQSKDEGGEWGLGALPAEHRPLIRRALDVYRSPVAVTEERRRTGGLEWDRAALLAFRDFARSEMRKHR